MNITLYRGMPSHVRLPTAVTHIAAGSNHTVILTSAGLVYTFGSYQVSIKAKYCVLSNFFHYMCYIFSL